MRQTNCVTVEEFCDELPTSSAQGHFRDGTEYLIGRSDASAFVPVKVLAKPPAGIYGAPIVITFHGSVNQAERKIPGFYGDQVSKRHGNYATVLSIADPSLRLNSSLLSTWYAGDYQINTQAVLSQLFGALRVTFYPSKYIFLGGSTGAHPALYHSHKIAESICLVANPLPSIRGYYKAAVELYMKECWPGFSYNDVFDERLSDSICEMYRTGHSNTVIVLQNCFDHHLMTEVIPFVNSLRSPKKSLFLSEFFSNSIGHSYPSDRWLSWIGAILGSGTGDLVELAHIASMSNLAPDAKTVSTVPTKQPEASNRDIQIARQLAADLK